MPRKITEKTHAIEWKNMGSVTTRVTTWCGLQGPWAKDRSIASSGEHFKATEDHALVTCELCRRFMP